MIEDARIEERSISHQKGDLLSVLAKSKARKERRKDNAAFQAKVAGKPLLQNRKEVRARLDAIISLIVRMRDKKLAGGFCLVCRAKKSLGMIPNRGMNPIALGYHVIRRGREAVRWALENVVGACSACNQYERLARYQQPDILRRIHSELVGEETLRNLEETARAGAKFSTAELRETLARLKTYLEARP